MAHNPDGEFPEIVVITVGEGLGRGYDDGFSGVDAQRVEVLHVADRDSVVIAVADHFIFDFLPALQGLFDKDLRGERKGFFAYFLELLHVVAEA